mgnify:CR=1 FL=1
MSKKPRPTKPGQPPPPPPPLVTRPVMFVWGPVSGATDYKLQVGSVSLGADLYNVRQGNVLTAEVAVSLGVRYTRVVAYQDATPLFTTMQQVVVVL